MKPIARLPRVLFACLLTVSCLSPAYAEPKTQNSSVYVIVPGDTLTQIAASHAVDIPALLHANPQITDADLIYAGEELQVPQNTQLRALEQAVVEDTNQARALVGLPALEVSDAATQIARMKSQDMVDNNYFAHESPTYGSPFAMMRTYGLAYDAAGENLAFGQSSAEQVVADWLNSPGHRANIYGAVYTQIGVGIVRRMDGRLYYTQLFLRPKEG